jgi:hypothetical protein
MFKSTLIALACLLCTQMTFAETDYPFPVQGLFGVRQFSDFNFTIQSEDGTEVTETGFSTIPEFGGSWFTKPKGDTVQVGLECNLLFGLKADNVSAATLNNTLLVRVESFMWMADLSAGPYLNLNLSERARIYASGGPLLMYIHYSADQYEEDEASIDPIESSESETSFSVGAYARTGLEFRVHNNGYVGFGVRGAWSDVNFSETVSGPDELSSISGFITYTLGL